MKSSILFAYKFYMRGEEPFYSITYFREAWDLAVDQCLSQLPEIIKDESKYKVCTDGE